MKYIGLFENFNETTEDFFKPIINWKLIEYLEYELTKISDKSDDYGFAIFIKTSENNIWQMLDSEKGEYNRQTDANILKRLYYKNGITYGFNIQTTDKLYRKTVKNIYTNIRNKFNIKKFDDHGIYVDIELND